MNAGRHGRVRDEVTHWFFDDYLPTWVGVGSGEIERGPDFILDYWSAPLYISEPPLGAWYRDGDAVIAYLAAVQNRLQEQGYTHTVVPDQQVLVYHEAGAAIEVIWSRCRADGSEIERYAVHFEIGRGPEGWRIVGIQLVPTTADSLDAAW
ncbi:hypothetical protein [Streptomyces sp. NPDC091217]|uniref:DUF6841 family protein n=1 Tax=Streptomyces sp. NPDC091217 TaxID=3365975 RepID=UPI003803DC68